MSGLTLNKICKSYGPVDVIRSVDLEINKGEFIVFVGPSGCGKSTLLRMIAGLEEITSGDLYIEGQKVNDIPSSKRGIAMVFQTYALYPHMTVFDNMAFSMRIAHAKKDEIDKRVNEAADILQLGPYLDRLPKALSGGQRQRVAIGRAIVRQPKVFLFDEPLSNLDAALRVATRIEIAKLHDSMPDNTMIYVTHDQVEAMTLADRIVVLSAGNIEQFGAPIELYDKPANLFVARFIGSPAMNIFSGNIAETGENTQVQLKDRNVSVPISSEGSLKNAPVQCGIRPEDFIITEGDDWIIEGNIALAEALGEVTYVYLSCELSKEHVIVKVPGTHRLQKRATIRLTAPKEKIHLFDKDGYSLLYSGNK